MNDIAELMADMNKVVMLQAKMIDRIMSKLLEYMEIDEIENMCSEKAEVEEICNRWKS